jgi:hypothetical protein
MVSNGSKRTQTNTNRPNRTELEPHQNYLNPFGTLKIHPHMPPPTQIHRSTCTQQIANEHIYLPKVIAWFTETFCLLPNPLKVVASFYLGYKWRLQCLLLLIKLSRKTDTDNQWGGWQIMVIMNLERHKHKIALELTFPTKSKLNLNFCSSSCEQQTVD